MADKKCDGTPECSALVHKRGCWRWRASSMTVDVYRCESCGETAPTPAMAWDHVLRNGHPPVMTRFREPVEASHSLESE